MGAGLCYPDIALVPSIANYFGVLIDELFGYNNDHDRKIDTIIKEVDAFHIKSHIDDEWVDECLGILRADIAEFPQYKKRVFLQLFKCYKNLPYGDTLTMRTAV